LRGLPWNAPQNTSSHRKSESLNRILELSAPAPVPPDSIRTTPALRNQTNPTPIALTCHAQLLTDTIAVRIDGMITVIRTWAVGTPFATANSVARQGHGRRYLCC
jgi:hypothetical protein